LKNVYPGVTIRFSEVQCVIEQAICGPVQFVPRVTKSGLTVCAVSGEGSRYALPLPSQAVRDDLMQTAMHALRIAGVAASKPAA
jgi:hypothetical protein